MPVVHADLQLKSVVLVVDDSPDSLSLINDTLEQAGISVLVALEGRQALAIARRMKPDMILLDAVMPHMDGFETCARIKEDPHLNGIPVIFMTGLSDTAHIVRGLEAGGVDYLTKPIRPDELLARMRVHLANARLSNSAREALDSTGQKLMKIARDGRLLWATPQSSALLDKAGLTADWLENKFAPALAHWLEKSPALEQTLAFNELERPVAVSLIEVSEDGSFLLRLHEGALLSEEDRLKNLLNLTTREAEVLRWIAHGKTNREIGRILDISPRTVNKHLEQVFQKINVENRTTAASIAIRALADNP